MISVCAECIVVNDANINNTHYYCCSQLLLKWRQTIFLDEKILTAHAQCLLVFYIEVNVSAHHSNLQGWMMML